MASFPSDSDVDIEEAGADVAASELEEEAGAAALEELDPAGAETGPEVPPIGGLPGGVTLLEVPSAALWKAANVSDPYTVRSRSNLGGGYTGIESENHSSLTMTIDSTIEESRGTISDSNHEIRLRANSGPCSYNKSIQGFWRVRYRHSSNCKEIRKELQQYYESEN